jgi:hypothetical protein
MAGTVINDAEPQGSTKRDRKLGRGLLQQFIGSESI